MSIESSPQFTPRQERQETIEVNVREALDEMSLETSKNIYQLDAFIDGKEKLTETDTPITQKYREAVAFLENKSAEELRAIFDPEGKFIPEEFSHFEISIDPPGAIHLELGNSADLAKLIAILNTGRGSILKYLKTGDDREIELFAAQYYSPKVFGGGNYLGVIVTIREHNQDPKTKQKILRHEYSHALMQEVIRPLSHRKVVNIGLGDSLREVQGTIDALGPEKATELAEVLGVVPPVDTRDHMRPLVIGTDIYNEQYFLDELRAYTFSAGPLPPKRQITDKELEGEDNPQSAKVETVKKYFEVNLLHTKARLTSKEARARSLAILGSALSLEQAKRLLEQDSASWEFDQGETNQNFEDRIDMLNKILNDPEYKSYRDFQHQQGGELVSQEKMKQVILPNKEMVDAEVIRRYGSIGNAPAEFQQNYSAIY